MANAKHMKTHEDDYPPPARIEGSDLVAPPGASAYAAPTDQVETIGDEQRKRSDEMQAMGVDAWMKAHSVQPEAESQIPPPSGHR